MIHADKKLINLFQEVYLFLYDLTGVTVGTVLFTNLIVLCGLLTLINYQMGMIFIIISSICLFYYYALHMIQISENIKLYNRLAIDWENSYYSRIFFCLFTLSFFIVQPDWRMIFVYFFYVIMMYLPAVKIRERDKYRFKIVKWKTANA